MKDPEFARTAERLAEIGRGFYDRGWVLGTSGNFSAVVSRSPLRLAITPSGADKGALAAEDILAVDERGERTAGEGRPSAETPLHIAIVRLKEARAVLHTHSVWANIVSELYGDKGGFPIEGHEMLKGLSGVTTHRHVEWLPVIENSQDYRELARNVEAILKWYPESHGILLRRHGLYTWGRDLEEARRHVEILEYLLDVVGRTTLARAQ